MLNKNIINIKNVLKIIISVLIIFSMSKSCSKAYTFDNFITYCRQIVAGDISGASSNWYCKTMAQNILNNETAIRNATNVNNYTCFVCSADTNTHYFAMYGACGFQTVGANYTNCHPNNITQPTWGCRLNQNNIQTSYGSDPISGFTTNINWTFGLVTGTISTQNRGYFNLANLVIPLEYISNISNIATFRGTTTRVMFEDIYRYKSIQIGTIIPHDAVRYSIDLKNENSIVVGNYDNSTGVGGSYFGNNALQYSYENNIIISPLYLSYNEIYLLDIEYQVEYGGQNYYDGSTFVLCPTTSYIDNGAVVITSGDFTNQDNAIQIINNNNDNNDFWKDVYNSLFTISGDYIEQKLNSLELNLETSGDIELEKKFLDLINNNNNGDFIISWGNFTPHFSIKGQQIDNVQMISGDQINFSKMEREIPEFAETMKWARVILGFSFGALLLKNYWTTIMHTLGVGVQVYDKNEDEAEKVKKGDSK